MLLRTVSIIGLLSFSTVVYAQDPAVDPTKTETPSPTDNSTQGDKSTVATPDAATPAPAAATEGSAATAGTPENTTDGTATTQEPVKQEPVVQEPVKQKPVAEESGHEGGHSGQFTIEEMWSQSSGPVRIVLGTLLFMLVAAMGVGLERLITLGSARSQSRKLAGEVGALLTEKDGKMKEALAVCARDDMAKSYLGHLLAAGLKEFESREDEYGIEAVERAIEKNAITETAALNKGLNILATVGSTAPFVGLVGTIFGIINAFGQIGAEGGADLTTLAPAIGEALITTAFGIIVAIVGVWLFNYFTAMIGSITNDMAESSQELVDWCHKRIRPDMKSAK